MWSTETHPLNFLRNKLDFYTVEDFNTQWAQLIFLMSILIFNLFSMPYKNRWNIDVSMLFRRASKYSYGFQCFFDVDSTLKLPAGKKQIQIWIQKIHVTEESLSFKIICFLKRVFHKWEKVNCLTIILIPMRHLIKGLSLWILLGLSLWFFIIIYLHVIL